MFQNELLQNIPHQPPTHLITVFLHLPPAPTEDGLHRCSQKKTLDYFQTTQRICAKIELADGTNYVLKFDPNQI